VGYGAGRYGIFPLPLSSLGAIAPLGDNVSMGRGRGHCARMKFFYWLLEWGKEEGAGREGGFCWLVARLGYL
jgi:hypothetical protein